MKQSTFQPTKNATNRTKNRFREHTLVIDSSGEEERRSTKVHGFLGVECILFKSVERDTNRPNSPRWRGWIPASEVQRTKQQLKKAR